jgi:hypothetical protein
MGLISAAGVLDVPGPAPRCGVLREPPALAKVPAHIAQVSARE